MRIKQCGEDFVDIYDNIKEAALSIDTSFDLWKVELLIHNAIVNNKKAFKCKWMMID